MEDAARKMGKTAYLLDQTDGTLSAGTGSSSEGIDQSTQTILQAGINPATMQLMLLTDSSLSQLLESSRVSGGISGLHTYASSYDPGSGLLDLVVNYDYKVPWLPGSFGNLRLVQRARCHAWVGDSLQKGGDSDGTDSHKVYVTPTGTVYHTSPDCNYLDLSIQAVTGYAVSGMRNAAGARYYPCEECARGGLSGTVYITDYGTRYHTSLGCSGLKRTVQEVELDDVGDMRMCTKCASHEAHEH